MWFASEMGANGINPTARACGADGIAADGINPTASGIAADGIAANGIDPLIISMNNSSSGWALCSWRRFD